MRIMVFIAFIGILLGGCSNAEDASGEIRRLRGENAALRKKLGGKNAYQCTVLAYRELADDGLLHEGITMRDQIIGASFVVDKNTGLIAGGIGNNGTFESHNVVFTPPGNLFYVISESHGPNKSVDFLSVRDWAEGPEKPFLLIDSAIVSSGICQ